jgi:murein DD-endopeptidase MepM/ murein hydrolase activator NlpD
VPDPVQQSQTIDRQLSQYRQQYAEVSADEVDLLAHVDAARQAKDAADLELARLDSSLQEALTALTAAQQARDAAAAASAAAATRLTDARAKASAAEDLLRRQALDAYVDQGRFGVLTAVFAPASDEDALTAPYYARLAGGIEADRAADARTTREEAAAAESAAAAATATAASTEAELERSQVAAQQARDAQAAAQQLAADELTKEEQALTDLQQQEASYQSQIDQLQADSRQIAAVLRQRAAAVTTAAAKPVTTAAATPAPPKPTGPPKSPPAATAPPKPVATAAPAPTTAAPKPATTATGSPVTSYPQDYATGKPPVSMALSYPIPGAPIVSGFGMRVDPVLHTHLMHEGIDIWAPEGTPIHAAGSGTVIWAGDRHGYGNAVFIDHGQGVVTVYAHQSKVGVAVGQHVGTGDTIGYVGHTGLAAGPHLHFEVRVNGTAYDPLNFVSPR